jgi:hypothetical protein
MTEKAIANKSKKSGNPAWVKGMKSPNPKGRPAVGQSRKEQIEKVLINTPAQIVKQLGGRNELAKAFRAMPQDVPLVELLITRVVAATMFEPQPGLVNFLFDSVYGKVAQPIELTWREEARKQGVDPDKLVAELFRNIAALDIGIGDAGGLGAEEETNSLAQAADPASGPAPDHRGA